jgi:acetyl-CoA synthetase
LVPIAKPDKIQFVSGLPKTRSGKIMRRILRKIAEGETQNLGDTSHYLIRVWWKRLRMGRCRENIFGDVSYLGFTTLLRQIK